jgi:adenosylhomocysteine nucleosidase
VVNTGSAGGTADDLSFGDIVIATGLVQHDVDVTPFGYKPGQVPGAPPVFATGERFLTLAEDALAQLQTEGLLPAEQRATRGLIASGDVFMHEKARIDAVKRLFPDVKAVEMESAAIAQAAFLFKTPCLVIRALSDVAGKESPMTHDEFLPLASKNSALLVRRIVRNYK